MRDYGVSCRVGPRFIRTNLGRGYPTSYDDYPAFPTPFHHVNSSGCYHFTRVSFSTKRKIAFPTSHVIHVLFIVSNSLVVRRKSAIQLIASGRCMYLTENRHFIAATRSSTRIIILSLVRHVRFYRRSVFSGIVPCSAIVPARTIPQLSVRPAVRHLLYSLFTIPRLDRYTHCRGVGTARLFVVVGILCAPARRTCFFRSVVRPRSGFHIFIYGGCSGTRNITRLTTLTNVDLSIFGHHFTRRFGSDICR